MASISLHFLMYYCLHKESIEFTYILLIFFIISNSFSLEFSRLSHHHSQIMIILPLLFKRNISYLIEVARIYMIMLYNSGDNGYLYCVPDFNEKGSCVSLLGMFGGNF